jgi:hypothetical protein
MKKKEIYPIAIIKSIYQDTEKNIWEIKRESLPKKKGQYVYWLAECKEKNISFRKNLKRDIIKEIKNLTNNKPK